MMEKPFTEDPSSLAQSVNPAAAGRLTSFFRAGSSQGDYDITFTLNDGELGQKSTTMSVSVVPEPSGALLGILAIGGVCLLSRKRIG